MKTENWALKKIIPYEKNPRKNEEAVAVVARSIKERLMKTQKTEEKSSEGL